MKTKVYSAKSMMISVLSREFMLISFHSAGAFASRSTGIERKVPLIFFIFYPLKIIFQLYVSNIVSHKHNRHETACEPRNYTLIIFSIVFFIGEIGRDYRWPAKVDTLVDYFIYHGICKARLKF